MVECTLFMTHCLRLNLQLHTISLVRTRRISSFCTVACNWQDYYWQDASRGHSAIAELLVCLYAYAISLVSVCADGDSPPPTTSVSIGTRRLLYEETTVRLRRRRRCDVLLLCRRVRNNKTFLHEPCSAALTLHKPSAIRGSRTTNMNPLLWRGLAEASALSPKPPSGRTGHTLYSYFWSILIFWPLPVWLRKNSWCFVVSYSVLIYREL